MKARAEDSRINVRDAQVTIHMGEYNALRSELISFQGLEYQAIQFAIGAITAIVGLLVQVGLAGKGPTLGYILLERQWILLVAPPFLLLGSLFAYAQFKVMLVAAYLNQSLRPKLVRLVKTDVLGWETDRRHHLFGGNKLLSEVFSLIRWLLFLWPLFVLLPNGSWKSALGTKERWVLHAEELLFIALCVLALYCWFWLPKTVVRGTGPTHPG